jgi:DNA-binding NtrC family response regulator
MVHEGHGFDVLITDLTMPEMDGIAVLSAAQQVDPDLVSLLMTGHGSIDTAVDAIKNGALERSASARRRSKRLTVSCRL